MKSLALLAMTTACLSTPSFAKTLPSEPQTPEETSRATKQLIDQAKRPPKMDQTISPLGTTTYSWAAGVNLAWLTRRDYGARTYRRFSPELVGYYYGELPYEQWFWRAGARLGYTSGQPEMPQAVRLEETDTTILAEGALTFDWVVVPSFALGYGYDFRTIRVKTKAPLDSVDSRLNHKETLTVWYVQTGLGVPLLQGRYMIEPILRYHTIQYDDRSHWTIGVEATVGF